MDFAALDFETANRHATSACSVGVALVKRGELAERNSWLIRPPTLEFDHFNIRVHGIRPKDVEASPTWANIWPDVSFRLKDKYLIAHNVRFDLGVLQALNDHYSLPPLEVRYLCSWVVARKTWPDLVSYRLSAVGEFLGIEFKHHDAGEDAWVSAEIIRAAATELGVTTIEDLCAALSIRPGHLFHDGHMHMGGGYKRGVSARPPEGHEFDPEHPLYGRTVAITGRLQSMVRQVASQLVSEAGGQVGSSVSSSTDFLVIGGDGMQSFQGETGAKSRKIETAKELIGMGSEIEVIGEDDFLEMIQFEKGD